MELARRLEPSTFRSVFLVVVGIDSHKRCDCDTLCRSTPSSLTSLPSGSLFAFLCFGDYPDIIACVSVSSNCRLNLSYVTCVARHAHNVAFHKSDLFFICMLRPVSSEIKIDETEIQAAKVRLHLYFKGISSRSFLKRACKTSTGEKHFRLHFTIFR